MGLAAKLPMRLQRQDTASSWSWAKVVLARPVAAALALGLAQRGKTVHLSTTDPAAHLAGTLNGAVEGLQVDRIDPIVETQRYVDKIMATKGAGLNEQERALMLEDLKSPCTEEVAVFHAFSAW